MSNVPKEIKQVSEAVWEIPTLFKEGMNVPARIIATEKLLNEMDEGVFQQVANVACLPGIVGYSFAMPDAHWGYGSCIGGVSAFDPEIGGIISPGIVGFDINCIDGNSKILCEHGYFIKIKDYDKYNNIKTKSICFDNNKEIKTEPILFLRKENEKNIYKITTKNGSEIIATGDHPFFTNKGMVEIDKLNLEEHFLAINAFDGVEYDIKQENIILDEEKLRIILKNDLGISDNIYKTLGEKNILPLTSSSPNLPVLAKLVGFFQGDGWLGAPYYKKQKKNIWSCRAIGKKEDLLKITEDINKLGFNASAIKTVKSRSYIKEINGNTRIIDGESHQISINNSAFSLLLYALGVPKGNKSRNKIFVPEWIKNSPLWVKRLYLAGLFGAEMSSPLQAKDENYRFKEPSFNQNKIIALKDNLLEFMYSIKELLYEFDVECTHIYNQKGVINKKNEETVKIILKISSKINNLINLWGKIGFEYSEKKKRYSLVALQYLKTKRNFLNKINKIVENAFSLKDDGLRQYEILEYVVRNGVSQSQIKSRLSLDNRKDVQTRISRGFLSFKEFVLKYQLNEESDFIWDEIYSIIKLDLNMDVYDFSINHKDHNFIANNFILSNCGMKLVRTNLTWKDVEPKSKELVDTLFKMVPAGVGVKGFVKINKQQFKEAIEQGSKWCVENGYGWKEDLERTESYGIIDWADSSKVSDKATSRGINQLGTLGSGNHYLEVQVVKEENIFDKELAKKFGIFSNQVVVMVHSGSRGFGHEVATQYMKIFEPLLKKYEIKIRDRELVCAPFNSKEGQDYYKAMACASNMAFANRQVIAHRIREAFQKVFNQSPESMEMHLVYDVAHNIARFGEFKIDGKKKKLLVHRKGATQALGPGSEELAPLYRDIGQPVIIGGSMETGSYLLIGTNKAEEETFGSTSHGSGRTMSRTKAKHMIRGDKLQKDMEKRGIIVKSASMSGLAEEWGNAYKDINEVVKSVSIAGISKPVVGLIPKLNVKG